MGVTKYILPVIIGVVIGMILISVGELGMHILYPLPVGTDINDPGSIARYIRHLPDSAFAILVINYAVCSFLAGLIATLIARRTSLIPALVVGIVLSVAGIFNIISVPQPVWVSIFSMLVYLPFAYFGYLLARKKE